MTLETVSYNAIGAGVLAGILFWFFIWLDITLKQYWAGGPVIICGALSFTFALLGFFTLILAQFLK